MGAGWSRCLQTTCGTCLERCSYLKIVCNSWTALDKVSTNFGCNCTHVCMCVQVNLYVCTHTDTSTYVCMYICVYICTQPLSTLVMAGLPLKLSPLCFASSLYYIPLSPLSPPLSTILTYKGEFGIVYRAYLRDWAKYPSPHLVAVKTIKGKCVHDCYPICEPIMCAGRGLVRTYYVFRVWSDRVLTLLTITGGEGGMCLV